MEYYDFYDSNYITLVKGEGKRPLTKIEVLNHNETPMYDISNDVVVGSDSISITYAQGVQGKASFDVVNRDHKYDVGEDCPFWIGNKLKIYKGIEDSGTGDIYWFTKGIFVATNVSSKDDIISVDCVDKFGLLTSETGAACFENNAEVGEGYTLQNFFTDVLRQDKGNGFPTDPKSPIIDFSARKVVIGEMITANAGSYVGDIFVDVANSVRCRIYYNNFGNLVLQRPDADFAYSTKAPVWVFNDKTDKEFISLDLNYDFANVKNRVTVWGENFNGVSYVATVVDDNPKSPVRVSKVGYRVENTVEDMFGYDQRKISDFAKMYLQMKTIVGLSINAVCTTIPNLNVEDVVEIHSEKYNMDGERFLISGINYNGNEMKLSLTNVDHLPQYKEMNG